MPNKKLTIQKILIDFMKLNDTLSIKNLSSQVLTIEIMVLCNIQEAPIATLLAILGDNSK